MDNVLFINACVREESRTLKLAKCILDKTNGIKKEVNLYLEDFKPLDNETIKIRDHALLSNEFSDHYFSHAKDFKNADVIIIAAPYWDLSFPAVLKVYLENICVNGLTFKYLVDGSVLGLCRARKLIYVATSGGYIPDNNYAFNYIDTLSKEFYGINDTEFVKLEALDIYPDQVDKKIEEKIKMLNRRY